MFEYYGLDIVATIFVAVSYSMIGNKNKYGFVFSFLSCVIWLVIGVVEHMSMLVVMNVVIMYFVGKGFLNWNKEQK